MAERQPKPWEGRTSTGGLSERLSQRTAAMGTSTVVAGTAAPASLGRVNSLPAMQSTAQFNSARTLAMSANIPRSASALSTNNTMMALPPRSLYRNSISRPGYGNYGNYGNYNSYGSSYGGYGSYGSSYGGMSRFGNQNYGSYGGYGGYGGYGSRMGGGMYREEEFGPNAGQHLIRSSGFSDMVASGYKRIDGFYSFVEGFTRFSHLLEMNFEAIYSSFTSIVTFFEHLLSVGHELKLTVQALTVIKLIHMLVVRLQAWFDRVLGLRVDVSNTDAAAFESFQKSFGGIAPGGQQAVATAATTTARKPSFWVLFFAVLAAFVGLPLLLVRLGKFLLFKYVPNVQQLINESNEMTGALSESIRVRVICDFAGENRDDLQIRVDDVLQLERLPSHNEGWVKARNMISGAVGMVPIKMIELLPPTTTS